jgi:hypothetical protein
VAFAALSSPGRSPSGLSSGSLGSSGSPSGRQASAGTGPTAAARATVPGTAIAATGIRTDGVAKTALQWPPALENQIVRWKEGSGGTALTAVTGRISNATLAGGAKLYPSMRAACVNLGSAIKIAQGAPPIPDGTMQRVYAASLAVLSTAAADCHGAISAHQEGDEVMVADVNKALLSRAMTQFAAGSKELYTATAEIRTLVVPK